MWRQEQPRKGGRHKSSRLLQERLRGLCLEGKVCRERCRGGGRGWWGPAEVFEEGQEADINLGPSYRPWDPSSV